MDKQHTLLIVDDEPFNLEILQEHLEDEGYRVVKAEDGPTALKILEANEVKFSAVLLDRMMPYLDGLDVLKKIKASGAHKRLPVIMQTAAATDKDIMEGIAAGAFYYLTKPFEPELMISIVQSAIIDFENINLTDSLRENSEGRIFSLIKTIKLEFKSISDALIVAGRVSDIYPEPDKVLLGLTELVINAVEHGNLGISYEDKSELLSKNTWKTEISSRLESELYKNKIASLHLEKSNEEIVLTVKDQGKGFNWKKFIEMSAERVYDAHGRGIAMASMISFDSMEYLGNGSEVRCVVKLQGS